MELFESAQLLVHVGLALGLHVGTTEATALENAAAAARSRTLETEREHRELLLGLLRHYILNGLTVIEGYADRLGADLEDPQREWAETIQHRAANTADVLDNAALLLRTEGADAAIRPAAVGDHLVRECERSSPEGVSVAAATDFRPLEAHADYQKAVELLVTGLLQAIEDPGRITVEQAGDTISITASPAQVPEHLEAELEEPIGSDVGLPLFLATELFAPAIELAVRTPGPETLAIDLACSIAEGDVDGTSTRTRH